MHAQKLGKRARATRVQSCGGYYFCDVSVATMGKSAGGNASDFSSASGTHLRFGQSKAVDCGTNRIACLASECSVKTGSPKSST